MKLNNKNGTAIVEFALVLPLLLLILMGIIEFSLVLYDKAMITNASREGARAGIVYRLNSSGEYNPVTTSEITDSVNTYLSTYLIGFPKGTATVTAPPCTASSTSTNPIPLTVTVTYPYNYLVLPNFVNILGNPLTLTAVTTMRCE